MRIFQSYKWLLLSVVIMATVTGCATNPVTGKSELALVSEGSELDIGRKQYAPSRQMQGGDYKLEPGLSRYVEQVGQRLAKVSDRKLPYEFAVINDSTPNAWALPGGKIAINRGLLLELDNEAELAAVLAHEIVHAAARHGAKGMERGMLLQGALIATGVATRKSDYSRLAVGAAAVGANLINQGYSRGAELEADHFGIQYMVRAGYDPNAAVKLQETFVRLSKDKSSHWLAGLFASHPPSAERVAKNRQLVEKLAAGGELGRDRYHKMIAPLKRSADAYAAYDKGQELLAKKRSSEALKKAQKSIRIEPREALFYTLKGDALRKLGRENAALRAYDQAISRNRQYFRHFLQRGSLKQAMGDRSGARSDLLASIELMPTVSAHYLLGRQFAQSGDHNRALKHYRVAAASRTRQGKEAARELARIDLPTNPQRYIESRVGQDKEGWITLQIRNRSVVAVDRVRVLLGTPDAFGRLRDVKEYRVPGRVEPGAVIGLRTKMRLAGRAKAGTLGSRVVSARVAR